MNITAGLYGLSYGLLVGLLVLSNLLIIPSNLQMLLFTFACIFIGSHQSLRLSETEVDGTRKNTETLTKKDAMMFPVFGSIALFSLYVAYKYVGPWLMNLLLSGYVILLGMAAVAESFTPVVERMLPKSLAVPSIPVKCTIPTDLLNKILETKGGVDTKVSWAHLGGWLIAIVTGVGFWSTKHFVLHNIFAVSFAIQGIRLMSVGSFLNGFIMLWGLFIYDVFWVFGTDVMITVAKNFEGPVKLILPTSFDPWKQGILGLGDIVIPGVFVAINLRFDDFMARKKLGLSIHRPDIDILYSFEKPYFRAVVIAYLIGLLVTGLVMFAFNHGQPALLYLVPACTGACFVTSFMRGELKELWAYDETHNQVEEKKSS